MVALISVKPESDVQCLQELQRNYNTIFQAVLEQYYLPAYPDPSKDSKSESEFRTGVIEREIHGSMHATRVSIYVQILHSLNKQHRAQEINALVKILEQAFACPENSLITLSQLAGLFHDVARTEEHYSSEHESAEAFSKFLQDRALSQNLVSLFQTALRYKNKFDEFQKLLAHIFNTLKPNHKQNIQLKDFQEACNYIRQLIQDSDLLDEMRCTRWFLDSSLEFYQYAQKNCEPLAQDLQELMRNVHTLLYNQGDLLYDCKIHKDKGGIIPTIHSGSRFSLKIKTPYEHSNNIQKMVLKSFAAINYFSGKIVPPLDSKEQMDTVEAGFVPFVHGTSTGILPFLARTNFKLKPPLRMIEENHLAPSTGEINSRNAGYYLTQRDAKPSFGRLNNNNPIHYTLSKILSEYATIPFRPPQEKLAIVEQWLRSNKCSPEKLNEILVYLYRAKQWGIPIKKNLIEDLVEHFEIIKQYCYLLLCTARYLMPNLNSDPQSFKQNPAAFLERFGFSSEGNLEKYLQDTIRKNKLDFQKIWKNPSPEDLKVLMEIFEFSPVSSENNKAQAAIPAEPKIRLFCISDGQQNKYKQVYSKNKYNLHFYRDLPDQLRTLFHPISGHEMQANQKDFEELSPEILSSLVMKPKGFQGDLKTLLDNPSSEIQILNPADIYDFHEKMPTDLIEYILILEGKINQLKFLLNPEPLPLIPFSEKEKALIEKPFPLLLLSVDEDRIEIHSSQKREFRAKDSSLTLGKEISWIVTDTPENLERLEAYLEEYDLNVSSLLLENLKLGIFPEPSPHFMSKSLKDHTSLIAAPRTIVMGYLFSKQVSLEPKLSAKVMGTPSNSNPHSSNSSSSSSSSASLNHGPSNKCQ